MSLENIERKWPRLKSDAGYKKTSAETEVYNCFAWAAGLTDRNVDPTDEPMSYWPDNIDPSYDISSFEKYYVSIGFETCDNAELEPGFTKIVLFGDTLSGEATHAARQLPDGKWSSKMGTWEDISHGVLDSLEGYYNGFYWRPLRFMRKPI